MQDKASNTKQFERRWKLFIAAIILLGILLRLIAYLQNRNLMIDEANVARNIYERGFAALALPLSYEQYAPPVFLWLLKISSLLFGFGEQALRIYPFLAGIASLFVFYSLLKLLMPNRSLWYPLILFAVAWYFIRYSTELKQYISDVLIILSLLLLTLKSGINKLSAANFITFWTVVGSIAIWSSMPSVFALAGIGAYYTYNSIRKKEFKRLFPIGIVGMLWLCQFLLYYFTILKPQINSDYLHSFHINDFLFATPGNMGEVMQNWAVTCALFRKFGDDYPYTVLFNVALFVIGAYRMLRKNTAIGFLILIPVFATFLAAMLKQYSLTPRVALFVIPLLMIVCGYGLETLYLLRSKTWYIVLTGIVILFTLDCAYQCLLSQPLQTEQITDGFDFIKKEKLKGWQVYLSQGSVPALIYYTQIHPRKEKWKDFESAHLLSWTTNYDSLAQSIGGTIAVIYTNEMQSQRSWHRTVFERYFKEINKVENEHVQAYIYQKKQ